MGIVFFKRLALAVALVRETWILDIVPDYRDEETVLTVAGRIVSAPSEEAACGSGFDVVEQRFEKSGEAGSNIGLKTVFCRDTVHPFKRSLELLANVEQEVAIHQGLDHPHIIKLLFAVKALAERRDLDHRVYLGLELANGGTLRRQMLKGEPLGQAGIKTFVQLVSAVQYLHTVALVVHRDLNPNNVLFDEKGHVKLADFGCSMPLNKMGANPQRTPGY
ncbi:MAG: serine/threonine protein kinase, partial [Nitrospinales bacterium]